MCPSASVDGTRKALQRALSKGMSNDGPQANVLRDVSVLLSMSFTIKRSMKMFALNDGF